MMGWILSSWGLILAVLLLRRLLKGKISQRLQYALWTLVLVRLLVPVSFASSPFSVQNLTLQPGVKTVVEAVRDPIRMEREDGAGEASVTYLAPADDLNDPYSWADLLGAVWMAGVFVTGGFMLTCNVIFSRKARRGQRRLDAPQAKLPVYVSEQVQMPCLVGIFRPCIYLNAEAADETMLNHVLEHEQTHFRHGDHLIGVLRCLAVALHWYDPLVWYAAKVSKQDGELACDEGTLDRLGDQERLRYGQTLLALSCSKKSHSDIMLTATTMTGSKKTLKERIRRIAQRPKMTAVTLLALVLAAALAVGCTFTGAAERSEEELANRLARAVTSDEIAQVLEAFVRRSMEDDGGVMLVQYSDGIGYGYGLSAERCEEVAELFAQYHWEQSNSQPPQTTEEVLRLELSMAYGSCTIEIDPEDESSLLIYSTVFDEKTDTVKWGFGLMYRAEPKDVAPSFYEVLRSLYDQQKADTDQTITETQVVGES